MNLFPRRSQFADSGVHAVSFWLASLVLNCPSAWAAACNAQMAGLIVGKAYSDPLADKARIEANAATVRKLKVGQPFTMEFSGDRLNIVVDRKGIVVRVRCG